MSNNSNIIRFIREIYNELNEPIPLHIPVFLGNEKKYLNNCVDTSFVSSIGEYVDKFEELVAKYTGSAYSIAVVNGTSALQIALILAKVQPGEEVITQPLTFIATANAIKYANALPIFVDVDKDTLGMSPEKLSSFLSKNAYIKLNAKDKKPVAINKVTGRRISAILPMHTFGHPCKIDEIIQIGNQYNIPVIEDSAESLGSYYKDKHTGTFGIMGILSFNGNKTITTGGGGMILTNDKLLAQKAKHITTTAKISHPFEIIHDEIGYNYRLPNLNAALGCAQMEHLELILRNKRKTAERYQEFFESLDITFIKEPAFCHSNYWLNTILFQNKDQRNMFLSESNKNGVMTRPVWQLISNLKMYKNCQCGNLNNSKWFEDRIVNLPSSVIL